MSSEDGLICAFVLDGQGSGKELDWTGIGHWKRDEGQSDRTTTFGRPRMCSVLAQ
jgi:hypothetical protein